MREGQSKMIIKSSSELSLLTNYETISKFVMRAKGGVESKKKS